MISDLPYMCKDIKKEKCTASDQNWDRPGNEIKSVIYFIAARMRVQEEFRKNQSVTDQNQISQVC